MHKNECVPKSVISRPLTVTGESMAPAEALELKLSCPLLRYFHSPTKLPTVQTMYHTNDWISPKIKLHTTDYALALLVNQSKKFNSLQSYVRVIWVETRKQQKWFWGDITACWIPDTKKSQKVILFSSTLTHSQCDAGNITFRDFAVFNVQVFLNVAINKCINWCFVHLLLLTTLHDSAFHAPMFYDVKKCVKSNCGIRSS